MFQLSSGVRDNGDFYGHFESPVKHLNILDKQYQIS